MSNIWGNGCKLCAYTGEEWLNVSSGDGWAGRPCPHCVPGGELYDDREPPILRTLYGDVTMVQRGAAVDVVADDFGTWLGSV